MVTPPTFFAELFPFVIIIPPAFMPRGIYFSSFRSSVRVFVCSLLSVTFVEFTSKFLVKVSLSEYISLTTH